MQFSGNRYQLMNIVQTWITGTETPNTLACVGGMTGVFKVLFLFLLLCVCV